MPYVVNYFQQRTSRTGKPMPNEHHYLDQMPAGQLRELIVKVNDRPDLYVIAEYGGIKDYLEEPKPGEYVTLSEWLLERNITLDNSNMKKLASAIVRIFRREGRKPHKATRKDSNGKWSVRLNGFLLPEDEDLLKEALSTIQHSTPVSIVNDGETRNGKLKAKVKSV